MAVLHNKEHKIATVLEKLPKKYTDEQFVEKFISLYSKEWGKIKSAYIKQSQDKEPGTIINMPKPDLYLMQLLKNFIQQENAIAKPAEVKVDEKVEEKVEEEVIKVPVKTPIKKKVLSEQENVVEIGEKTEKVARPKKASAPKVAKEKK